MNSFIGHVKVLTFNSFIGHVKVPIFSVLANQLVRYSDPNVNKNKDRIINLVKVFEYEVQTNVCFVICLL